MSVRLSLRTDSTHTIVTGRILNDYKLHADQVLVNAMTHLPLPGGSSKLSKGVVLNEKQNLHCDHILAY